LWVAILLMLAIGYGGPLLLVKGCEAVFHQFEEARRERLANVTSPDGHWALVVERDPGTESWHQIFLRRSGDEELVRLGYAGDGNPHPVVVLWSDDSTVASVWLDGELSYVHDRWNRNPTPVELIRQPAAPRLMSRADLAERVRRLQSPWSTTLPTTRPVIAPSRPGIDTSAQGTVDTAGAPRRAP
jgi:hypothetical protein